jgi:hypothetical protein
MLRWLVWILIVPCLPARAAVEIGTGFNSSTAGRSIPALFLAYSADAWSLSFSSVGVQTPRYYHSAYTVSYLRTWKSGDWIWGPIESGFGLSILYASRGFADSGAVESVRDDVAIGPALRVNWFVADPVFLGIEALYGLRDFGQHLALNAQDHVGFIVGVRAW